MSPAPHELDVLSARSRRVTRLTSDRGWFALVDRIWLEPGDNTTPIGTLVLEPGGGLTLRGAAAAGVTKAGLPAADGPVAAGDELLHGGKRYELGVAGERACLRVWDPAAPARASFRGLEYYPIRDAWRVTARFVPLDPPRQLDVPFSSGDVGTRECPGALELELGGQPLRLLPVVEPDPAPRLFVLFADDTNRDETYAAGRFLYAPMPVDGVTVLDFNLALNPACVFNDLVVCPLPPRENRLPMRVEAGEKRYGR